METREILATALNGSTTHALPLSRFSADKTPGCLAKATKIFHSKPARRQNKTGSVLAIINFFSEPRGEAALILLEQLEKQGLFIWECIYHHWLGLVGGDIKFFRCTFDSLFSGARDDRKPYNKEWAVLSHRMDLMDL